MIRPRLASDDRGTTVIEFAMVAPIMGLLLMGSMDVAHTLYMEATLQGIVQRTARAGTIEGGQMQTALDSVDARIRAQVDRLAQTPTTTITRRFYSTYTQAERRSEPFTDEPSPGADSSYTQGEVFTDTNLNGVRDDGEPYDDTLTAADGTCNNGESYTDENNSSGWDRDLGRSGQGGAKDAVVYTVQVDYPSAFPLWKLIGLPQNRRVIATTVLRNQPYGDQESFGAPVNRTCS